MEGAFLTQACLRLYRRRGLCTTAGIGKYTDYLCQVVEAHNTATFLLPILPMYVGSAKFTVQLRTQFGGDDVTRVIKVEVGYCRLANIVKTATNINLQAEGVLREYDYSNELDPQGTFVYLNDIQVFH